MNRWIWLTLPILLATVSGCARHRPEPPQVATPPVPLILPAGSAIALRTAQVIDSQTVQPSAAFAVVVDRDGKAEGGQTILPSGSPATLILVRGTAGSLELRLASVTLNGDSFLVRNDAETGAPTSDGAELGTFLGGVRGTGVPDSPASPEGGPPLVVTGERIFVPVGSLLTFRLRSPMHLVGARSTETASSSK